MSSDGLRLHGLGTLLVDRAAVSVIFPLLIFCLLLLSLSLALLRARGVVHHKG